MKLRTTNIVVLVHLLVVAPLVFAMVGCDEGQNLPTSALDGEAVEDAGATPVISYRFFTGRDSFGVAMKIRIAGDTFETTTDGRCEPDMTVTLSGTGSATHLGLVDGMFEHCATLGDLSSFYEGQFELSGAGGERIMGTYATLPVVTVLRNHQDSEHGDVVIETKADINGGSVAAVQREDVEGRGDLRIVLKEDGSFTQTFDGWLLHHLATD